jgi:hypothetical protein
VNVGEQGKNGKVLAVKDSKDEEANPVVVDNNNRGVNQKW